jgi:hypothetical protein
MRLADILSEPKKAMMHQACSRVRQPTIAK